MYGGRGGGKSFAVAIALLILGSQRPLRILCTREIQKSIRDSVFRLLCDQIKAMQMEWFYTITDSEIRGKNGTLFIFSGLQQHTVDQLKSFEGCDMVWVEEAHSVSQKSWDVLIPTIRKAGSEIWMTLNPDMDTDATYLSFVQTDSSDTWKQEVNWRDNPWFPEELNAEREKFQRNRPVDEYEHIWEGKPRRVADGAIYRYEIAALFNEHRVTNVPYDPLLPVHTVWDLGWADSMAIIMVQRAPQDIRLIDHIEDNNRTLDWYVKEIEKRPYRWGTDFLPHDGRTRNFQTGKSTQEQLQGMGRQSVMTLSAMNIEEGIRLARMVFPRCYFDAEKTGRLLECLKRYRRDVHTKTGAPTTPLHSEESHSADAFRYLAMAESMMRNNEFTYEELPQDDWRL